MEANWGKQKELEVRILEAARQISPLLPIGKIVPFKEPDLIIQAAGGPLAVEITEVHRPPSESGFRPKQSEALHRKAIKRAEEIYRSSGAPPVTVIAYFESDDHWPLQDPADWNRFMRIQNKSEYMAQSLADFVRHKFKGGEEVLNFGGRGEVPLGFSNMSIFASDNPWSGGECGGDVLQREDLAERIRDKQEKLATYRRNFATGEIWLLIYNGVAVSESLSIPVGFDDWRFSFGFEKVLFFAALEREVYELRQ